MQGKHATACATALAPILKFLIMKREAMFLKEESVLTTAVNHSGSLEGRACWVMGSTCS